MGCELIVTAPVGRPVVVVPVVPIVPSVLGQPLLPKVGQPSVSWQQEDEQHCQDSCLQPEVLDQLVVVGEDEGGGDPGDPGQDGEKGGRPDSFCLPVVLGCGSKQGSEAEAGKKEKEDIREGEEVGLRG